MVWNVSTAKRNPVWRPIDIDGQQVKLGQGLFGAE
jgi:hypothetical protein